jgi:cell filamentation protein
MQDLEEEGYLTGLEKSEFVARLSHYYCEINVLHPFRIGNGLPSESSLSSSRSTQAIS